MAWSAGATRELVFLGTGTSVGVPMLGCGCAVCRSADPRDQRTRSSVLIRSAAGNLLIDTAPDLRTQLLRERIDMVHAVLYTHHHADHVFGLDDVRVFCARIGTMPIYCEPATEAFVRRAYAYVFDPIVRQFPAGGVPSLAFHRLERPSFRALDHQITPIPLRHGRYDCTGFRFGGLAYCTDVNAIPETSWPLLEGVETLILDALRFEPHPTHFTLDEALAVVARLRPRQTYLTHISCRLTPARARALLPPGVALAYDGLRLSF